ncbi:hypothetical protein PFDG_03983 [Plasmodium falciparum Dd2]|uniref:Rifin n=1 Tax=Plasmodium falciparum (isolate Dd2) TaxID=57267 RepID=A0A0L7M4U8_PLAF4|nr:hypothetical protein PFDG_03983 [Plasmodium falciparum Dd2]
MLNVQYWSVVHSQSYRGLVTWSNVGKTRNCCCYVAAEKQVRLPISSIISIKKNEFCGLSSTVDETICENFSFKLGTRLPDGKAGLPDSTAISQKANAILTQAKEAAADANAAESANVTAQLTTEQTTAINSTYASYEITIIASIVAIVVIVLVMVIIYLILRYRRKNKMKKKLQYIKLLKE